MTHMVIKPSALVLPISEKPSTLVHEAGHSKHWTLGKDFNQSWCRRAYGSPNPALGRRKRISKKSEEYGFVSNYAFAKFNQKGKKASTGRGLNYKAPINEVPFMVFPFQDSTLSSFDTITDPETLRENLFKHLSLIPNTLFPEIKKGVILDPFLPVSGSFCPGVTTEQWSSYKYIAEDVAESTSHFHATAHHPDKYPRIIKLIRENGYTRGRLETLQQFGFLPEDMCDFLLDY